MTTTTVPKTKATGKVTKVNGDPTDTSMPEAEITLVTPDMARLWLGQNKSNRTLRERAVLRYARDMMAGNWEFTGESIKFSSDGRLVDGQHRLTAVLHYAKPVLMLVVRGVQPRSQDVMDTGAKRTTADMFALNGKQYTAILASGARLAINWEAGTIRTAASSMSIEPTHSEYKDFVAKDPTLEWAAQRSQGYAPSIAARPSVLCFSLWLTGHVDRVNSIRFHQSLSEMTTDGPGDPRLALLRRLQSMKDERTTQIGQAFYFIKAWNAWRTGEKLRTIRDGGGPNAKPSKFPEPV